MSLNLKTDQAKVIRALVKVEGKPWLERQKKGQFQGYSVFDAIETLKTSGPFRTDYGTAIIYGRDGWNRYRVLASGEIEFLKVQAWGPEAIAKARAAGFRII